MAVDSPNSRPSPNAAKANPPSKPRKGLKWPFWVIRLGFHPFAILGGIWVLLVVASILTFNGLISPGEITKKTSRSSLQVNELQSGELPPIQIDPSQNSATGAELDSETAAAGEREVSLPVWSLALLTMSCAGGCFLLSSLFSRPPSSRKTLFSDAKRKANPKKPKQKKSGQSELKPKLAHRATQATATQAKAPSDSTISPQSIPNLNAGQQHPPSQPKPHFPSPVQPFTPKPQEMNPAVANMQINPELGLADSYSQFDQANQVVNKEHPSTSTNRSSSNLEDLATQLDMRNNQSLSSFL